MSTVEVYIDALELIGDIGIPDYATEAVHQTLRRGISKMQRYAETHHRFNSRTGTLVNSIRTDIYELSGRLYIDDMLCHYGKYVHNGQRSWAPDQFIYDAFTALSGELRSDLRDTVEQVELKRSANELAIATALLLASRGKEEEEAEEVYAG